MDILHKHLIGILKGATKDLRLVSWRIFGEENLQVTLKYTSYKATITDYKYGSTDMIGAQPTQYYQSKPPRCVARDLDQGRLVHCWQNKDDTGQIDTQHKEVAIGNTMQVEGGYTDEILSENI